MKNHRTIKGWGTLICGDDKTPAAYDLSVSEDKTATGTLHNVDVSATLPAFQGLPVCRLILDDGRELSVHITPIGDGSVEVHGTGQFAAAEPLLALNTPR